MTGQVVIQGETPVEDPEHVQAMVNAVDAANKPAEAEINNEGTPKSERPEGLPDNFKDVQSLVDSYKELQRKLTEGSADDKPADDKGGDPNLNIDTDPAEQVAAKAGLDMEALNQEYQTEGKLSDATYEALAKSGIDREAVDTYIAGKEAAVKNIQQEAYDAVGGEANYKLLSEWAGQNMTPAEKEAYNKAVNGNAAERSMAISALQANYAKAEGSEPNLISGDTGIPTGNKYTSQAQVVKDMNSVEYKTDPAFRKMVQDKLAQSDVI